MHAISKTFHFCYGHRLLNDKGKCRHLHGHSARCVFTLSAELDKNGMVVHFDKLKETIGKWIGENLDHALLLYEIDPVIKHLSAAKEKFLPVPFNPTAENIARMLFEKAKEFDLPVTCVEVWESETAKAGFKP